MSAVASGVGSETIAGLLDLLLGSGNVMASSRMRSSPMSLSDIAGLSIWPDSVGGEVLLAVTVASDIVSSATSDPTKVTVLAVLNVPESGADADSERALKTPGVRLSASDSSPSEASAKRPA